MTTGLQAVVLLGLAAGTFCAGCAWLGLRDQSRASGVRGALAGLLALSTAWWTVLVLITGTFR